MKNIYPYGERIPKNWSFDPNRKYYPGDTVPGGGVVVGNHAGLPWPVNFEGNEFKGLCQVSGNYKYNWLSVYTGKGIG